jgi:hypothetical protein
MQAATAALLAPLGPKERAAVDRGLAVLERLFGVGRGMAEDGGVIPPYRRRRAAIRRAAAAAARSSSAMASASSGSKSSGMSNPSPDTSIRTIPRSVGPTVRSATMSSLLTRASLWQRLRMLAFTRPGG